MSDISLNQSFFLQECCSCGCAFAVPASFDRARRGDGKNFYCPNGHPQCYQDTEAMKLRRELEAKTRTLDNALNRERLIATELKCAEAAKKRLQKRLANGVCPVPGCKRHFTDLHRHIKTQHGGLAALPQSQQKLIGSVQ